MPKCSAPSCSPKFKDVNCAMTGLRGAYDDVTDTTTGVINGIAGDIKNVFDGTAHKIGDAGKSVKRKSVKAAEDVGDGIVDAVDKVSDGVCCVTKSVAGVFKKKRRPDDIVFNFIENAIHDIKLK